MEDENGQIKEFVVNEDQLNLKIKLVFLIK